MKDQLIQLSKLLKGELYFDDTMRILFSTDASVYRKWPLAVAFPKTKDDLKQLIRFAEENNTSLIPRAAGTSLAGQCVGDGIVVDVSKHFGQIVEFNEQEKWVIVQPGVVRDDLNLFLKPYGLFFAPNTSTSNRCMIGGMVGNNSCGTTSIKYGTTRDHVLALNTLLSDGSEALFESVNSEGFQQKIKENTLEGRLYQQINTILNTEKYQNCIKSEFPKAAVSRRNDGYAIDALLEDHEQLSSAKGIFNFCKLLTGSEGTLAFTTEIKLNLSDLPPSHTALVCSHFSSLESCLKGVVTAMQFQPEKLEMMDDIIIDCTKGNDLYTSYRFFIEGNPKGILVTEFSGNSDEEVAEKCQQLIEAFQINNEGEYCGYAHPIVQGADMKKVWGLRKAGLGLLANIPGDPKAVAVIEDTAVAYTDLPAYIADFNTILKENKLSAVHYGHAGAGELHLRPILDLKKQSDRELFRTIGTETAKLVKKYQGSNSGEHGDGIVRGEFVPLIVGEENYQLFRSIKKAWDPKGIFNPNKIVDTPPMDKDLRYEADQETRTFDTVFDFSDTEGILRMAEKCNGTGECRKTHLSGGTMCPSYMATRNEKDTTRARANILREFLTRSNKENPFAHPEVKEVMDLCLSCKGCTSECPSNVDMATLKAEFQYQYFKENGIPLRNRIFANINKLNEIGSFVRPLANFGLGNPLASSVLKKVLGVAPQRSLPLIQKKSLKKWFKKNRNRLENGLKTKKGEVYFFADEFTNLLDSPIGIRGIELLYRLGYSVKMPEHPESGRAHFSKGLLKEAKHLAWLNFEIFKHIVNEKIPLVGIEPSCILTFRDEYPRLVDEKDREQAKKLGQYAMMIETFLLQEANKGNITPKDFTSETKHIKLHGHCHQKALASVSDTAQLLSIPENYHVEVIPSGCCGMAGSFGYEAEHYEVSMRIGELVLFPAVRKAKQDTLIVAPGTSCRHQIYDGTKRKALHPVEVL